MIEERQINIAIQGAYNAFIEINKRSPEPDEWEQIYTDARRIVVKQQELYKYFNNLRK